MNRKKFFVCLTLAAVTLTAKSQQTPVYLDDVQPIELRVKDALQLNG